MKNIRELTLSEAKEITKSCLDYETWGEGLSFDPVIDKDTGRQQITFSGSSIIGITFKFGINSDGGLLSFNDLKVMKWLAAHGYDISDIFDQLIQTEVENDEYFEKMEEMTKDFSNLLENYWYVVRTKECSIIPQEQENQEKYVKDLMKKWNIH
jgi:queuine/archaeosine tRNA-ribosyltransferase